MTTSRLCIWTGYCRTVLERLCSSPGIWIKLNDWRLANRAYQLTISLVELLVRRQCASNPSAHRYHQLKIDLRAWNKQHNSIEHNIEFLLFVELRWVPSSFHRLRASLTLDPTLGASGSDSPQLTARIKGNYFRLPGWRCLIIRSRRPVSWHLIW